MIDYFAELGSTGDLAADVRRFYQAVNRLDTLDHVTGVAKEAVDLAAQYGADCASANLAALAHDLAAVVPGDEMTAVAAGLGLRIGEVDQAFPMLLHGPIAAVALVAKLGVRDGDLLNAVRYHSTLRAGASTLEKIVFVADKIAYDPTAPHHGEYLPVLRSARSLDEAALAYLDFLLDHGWRYDWLLHPKAVAAYRDLIGRGVP